MQSLQRKVALIVCLFSSIVLVVFLLGELRSKILVGVRAYVGGEGLWSKAEKSATRSLIAYVHTRSESDYQDFLGSIAVPLGDRQARLELQKLHFDPDIVARGFVQGRNSPQDVAGMEWLFRWFHGEVHMAQAIEVWRDGDAYIGQMLDVAARVRQKIQSGDISADEVTKATAEITVIDGHLTPLEDEFSYTLGEGARWISYVLGMALWACTLLLLLVGTWFAARLLRRIRESDERYHHLFQTANDAILVMDAANGTTLEANQKASEYLGIPMAELKGRGPSGSWPPAERGPYNELFKSSLATGASSSDALHLTSSDGGRIPVEVSASRTEWEGKRAIYCVFRDIRYRLEAQEAAHRNEERFRSLVQNLSDIIIVLKVDGRMIFQTPSVEKVLGYERGSLEGKNFFDFLHAEDTVSVCGMLKASDGQARTSLEFRCRHRDGSWIWLEAVASNLLNDSAVGGVVLTARDISRRRKLEDEVRQAHKMEAIGQLAGGVAHDFNNLLMIVQAHADGIQAAPDLTDELRTRAETILKASDRAAALTRQLLTIGRKQSFAPKVLDPNVILLEIEGMLRTLLTADIQLNMTLDPMLGRVNADSGQLEQIVINLVVNARDAMPLGGRVIIETANVEFGDTPLRSHPNVPPGSYAMVSVTDTGTGIDPAIRERIFDPFFTTKPKGKGTGLGLSVVYGIVKQSGGYVSVYSEVGQGSVFAFYLPRVADEVRTASGPGAVFAERRAAATILVVEDEGDLRTLVCDYLSSRGYTVLEANNGPEAIAVAERHKKPIELLLTDVIMPEMRGPDLALQLVQSRPQMRVLYMSGYTADALSRDLEGIPSVKTALLQKPFRLQELAARIQEVLGEPSATETSRRS